jgi:predicted nucleotidyltransferase
MSIAVKRLRHSKSTRFLLTFLEKGCIFATLNAFFTMNAHLIQQLRHGLAHTPVQRAWLFGSFARSEESRSSDVDILVQFTPNAQLSLFDYGGIVYELEELTGRRVDMVQEAMLKPFAQKSVDRDKILIYEREAT